MTVDRYKNPLLLERVFLYFYLVNLITEKFMIMSVAEMKLEVINKIKELEDETVLSKVLIMLSTKEGNLSNHYDAIKSQYGDVLQKLAQ